MTRPAAGGPGAAETVVLRWLTLDDLGEGDFPGLARLLEPSEVERAGRFHFERDRRAYLAAHALLRALLSEQVDAPPRSWRFAAGRHGKPEIDPPSGAAGLRFNLSHTRGLVAVAVTAGHDVGVDVERVDPGRLGPDVTDRFFAPAEVERLRTLDGAARTEAAYGYWTLKEAYIKAIGLGLACPLDAFHFEVDPLGIRFSDRLDDDPARWLIRRLRPTPDHALALMVRHERPTSLRLDARRARIEELADRRSGSRSAEGA